MNKTFFFVLLHMPLLYASVDFKTTFESEHFKQNTINGLELIKCNTPVVCSISTRRTNTDPINFNLLKNVFCINFRKDVIDACSEEEILFFILSLSFTLVQKPFVFDPTKNASISSFIKNYALLYAPFIACTWASLFIENKYFRQRDSLHCNAEVALGLGFSTGLISSIYCYIKYRQYSLSYGDQCAATIVGHTVAINALQKVAALPRIYNNLIEKYVISDSHIYKQRHAELIKRVKK